MKKTDILIIGAGIAGLSAAYYLKDVGHVTVIVKGKLRQSNTYWAQGGVAAVMSKEDSFESHIDDTMKAGAYHNQREAVRHLVEGGPRAIRFLESINVIFNKVPALEGGHSHARVWRTSDFTGQDILNQLIRAVQKTKTIEVMEDTEAVELITHDHRCMGAFVRRADGTDIESLLARQTVLATGGIGQLFAKTSNPPGASGDGLALAVNAGLELKDMEFVQFHPTALDVLEENRHFLLSETLRGHGATIINAKGEPFLKEYDPRGELAPRDLVTRAIYFEQMNGPVYLDLRNFDSKAFKKEFPNITKSLKQRGFDWAKQPIPITPVAHFSCGGVPVDARGATQLPGLYAVGEVACSGVHGANRLASNALLEGVVFAEEVAKSIQKKKDESAWGEIDEHLKLDPPTVIMEPMPQVIAYAKRLGQIMWEKAGIVRRADTLKQALKDIEEIPARDYRIQHRQLVCHHLIQACLARPDSLGCHYMAPEIT